MSVTLTIVALDVCLSITTVFLHYKQANGPRGPVHSAGWGERKGKVMNINIYRHLRIRLGWISGSSVKIQLTSGRGFSSPWSVALLVPGPARFRCWLLEFASFSTFSSFNSVLGVSLFCCFGVVVVLGVSPVTVGLLRGLDDGILSSTTISLLTPTRDDAAGRATPLLGALFALLFRMGKLIQTLFYTVTNTYQSTSHFPMSIRLWKYRAFDALSCLGSKFWYRWFFRLPVRLLIRLIHTSYVFVIVKSVKSLHWFQRCRKFEPGHWPAEKSPIDVR